MSAAPNEEKVSLEWRHAVTVAIALFVLYAVTSPRSVALEDDGLFVLSSYFLGVEHPPGYPLFTLIGHAFSKLPIGEVAYRVHLASALFGALSGALAWLCARRLGAGRLAAYLGALGLGLSPVFWSQAIIAEVYTLNTFFFLLLAYLGLVACPPASAAPSPHAERVLPWMALAFGLSLSNHWPLMLLVAPAFPILLWPLRATVLRRFGFLGFLVLVGLLPYVWMLFRSWAAVPINFDGPLETIPEILFFVSRAGYAGVDQSASATWLDRIKFFEFQTAQLFVQLAVAGTLVALVGAVMQWRGRERRLAAFLTVALVMPSFVLLLLLGFDYDSLHKHIYHVYPLPSYAVAALWMSVGFTYLARRYALNAPAACGAAAVLLGLIAGVGGRFNLFQDDAWGADYAQAVLKSLPPNAVVFAEGDADLAPMAYFHMIQGQRPDITLYQASGLVLGNRLFHPLRTRAEDGRRIVRDFIDAQTVPVVLTLDIYTAYGRRDRWLYNIVDKSSSDPLDVIVDIPEAARRFFEQSVAGKANSNAWIAYFQGELRMRYASLLGRTLPRYTLDEQTRRDVKALTEDYYGALGLAEGLMLHKPGFPVAAIFEMLERAQAAMPSDVPKAHLARFFYIRGALRAGHGDSTGAASDFETSVSVYPLAKNPAVDALRDLYRQSGNAAALAALEEREKRLKDRRP